MQGRMILFLGKFAAGISVIYFATVVIGMISEVDAVAVVGTVNRYR